MHIHNVPIYLLGIDHVHAFPLLSYIQQIWNGTIDKQNETGAIERIISAQMKDIFLLNRRKCHTPMYDRDPSDPRNILGVIIEFG